MRRPALASTAVLAVVLGSSCYTVQEPEVPVWTQELGTPRYLRVNLRGDSVFLTSSNHLHLPIAVSIGTPVTIAHFGAKRVDLLVHHLRYTMYPEDGQFEASAAGLERFLDKYLVSDPALLSSPDAPARTLGGPVALGEVAVGMSKEDVYASLGPPRRIESHIPTVHLSRQQILQADRWVYTRNNFAELIPQDQVYTFNGGVLARVTPGT